MKNAIFDYEMTDPATIVIDDTERLYQIVTHNWSDSLYLIATPETIDDDARAAMRAKFGRRGPAMINHISDVTALVEMDIAALERD